MAWTAPRTWSDGELVTASIMNTHIRDNELAIGPHLLVRKTSDETVTSSATLQDDDALLFNVPANEIWQFEWIIRYEAGTTGDIKLAFTFPASGEVNFISQGWDTSGVTNIQFFNGTTSPTNSLGFGGRGTGAANRAFVLVSGIYVNGGTGGNVTLQWAQNTSDGTGTVVKANSTLWGVKLA